MTSSAWRPVSGSLLLFEVAGDTDSYSPEENSRNSEVVVALPFPSNESAANADAGKKNKQPNGVLRPRLLLERSGRHSLLEGTEKGETYKDLKAGSSNTWPCHRLISKSFGK